MTILSCSTLRQKSASPQGSVYPREVLSGYYYTEGVKNNITQGSSERSVALFLKALESDSTHAPSLFELANLSLQEPQEALKYSLKANALDTTNKWYRMQLGRLLVATQHFDSAFTLYRTLLQNDPANPENYRTLAALYDQRGEPEKALALLDSAELRVGIHPLLFEYKRQLLLNLKQYDRALRETQTMVETYPNDEENLVALAELYALFGKDSLATHYYDRAQGIDPNNPQTLASLNSFYKQRNDNVRFLETAAQLFRIKAFPLEPKLQFFEDLIDVPNYYRDNYIRLGALVSALVITYPNDPRTLKLYARHLMAGGSIEEALRFYKSHLNDSISDFNKELYYNVLEIEAYLKRPDSVARYASQALQHYPNDAELYLRKGSVESYYIENQELAEQDFKTALKYATSDSMRSVIYGLLGDTYHSMEDDKKSFKAYEKGIRIDTTNAVLFNNYAYFLSLRNEHLDKALTMVQTALRLSPNNPTYLDTYAWILYQMGRYEEARTPMRQAISLDRSNNKELYLHYGDILYKLKDHFMASFYWKKALELGVDPQEIDQRMKQIEKQ
ncbi:MAG: tetratricopeptide repeat protein [Alistipes sp.]|nr:tetratricopeptide repeat protein [Alistipes sp.]